MLLQKRLASQIFKCSPKRVKIDPEKISDIKEAITKADIKQLISQGIIKKLPARGISRARIRMHADQKRRGRRVGPGTRKGKQTARLPRKQDWMTRIRKQREFLMELRTKELVTKEVYNDLYRKSKGGFFRNKRHLKLYINEQRLIK